MCDHLQDGHTPNFISVHTILNNRNSQLIFSCSRKKAKQSNLFSKIEK